MTIRYSLGTKKPPGLYELDPETIKEVEILLKEDKKEDKKKKEVPKAPVHLDDKDFIYVPDINLYVAKERDLFDYNWHDFHKLLQAQGHKMLTILEFRLFLKYLRDNKQNPEYARIFNEITEIKSPWRAEYLDADFKYLDKHKNEISNEKGDLWIYYNHILDANGNLIPKDKELLSKNTLMQDKLPGIGLEDWINDSTAQGLPKNNIQDGSLYYRAPMKDNNSVGWFDAGSDRVYLYCCRNPTNSSSSLGVRRAKKI